MGSMEGRQVSRTPMFVSTTLQTPMGTRATEGLVSGDGLREGERRRLQVTSGSPWDFVRTCIRSAETTMTLRDVVSRGSLDHRIRSDVQASQQKDPQ